MDTRATNLWDRWKRGYPLSSKEYAILGAFMDEYYHRLSYPKKGKLPSWASGDYDKSNVLVSGWDYNR